MLSLKQSNSWLNDPTTDVNLFQEMQRKAETESIAYIQDPISQYPEIHKTIKFEIDPEFVNSYSQIKPPFGFNGLGELVYERTYSRIKPDGKTKEKWFETVERVVNGTYSMQKRWIVQNGLGWNEFKGQKSAQEMYHLIFNMKFLPPGRGLWAMGSPMTEERKLYAALNNCSMVSTEEITEEEPDGPFSFLMDASMLGVGVGFDTKGAGKLTICCPQPNQDPIYHFQIPDSREGWVESLRLLIRAHLGTPEYKFNMKFDYSQIRPQGLPIKGFGGISSGSEPLEALHKDISRRFQEENGKLLSVTLIVDIMNMIGRCVIAGNVRRTAEISFGELDSEEFIDLKNYEKNPQRMGYGWCSNNSIFAKIGMNYESVATRVALNGEPGFAWLDTMRQFGRMNDPQNNKDSRVVGANPCCPDFSLINTTKGIKTVKELIGKDFEIYMDGKKYNIIGGFFKTGNKTIYNIQTVEGYELFVTDNHKVLVEGIDGINDDIEGKYPTPIGHRWVEVRNLIIGDEIVLENTRLNPILETTDESFDEGWLLGLFLGDGNFSKLKETCVLEFWGNQENREKYIELILQRIKTLGGDVKYDKIRHGCVTESRNKICTQSKQLYNKCLYEYDMNIDTKLFSDLGFQKILSKSISFKTGLIRGLFDSDGSPQGTFEKGFSIRLSSTRIQYIKLAQLILLSLGIYSKIYVNRKIAGKSLLPDGKGGMAYYQTKPCHELVITKDNIPRFKNFIGFDNPNKKQKLNEIILSVSKFRSTKFTTRFLSMNKFSEDILDVYDCTVPEIHRFSSNGIIVANCLEQSLESYEMCCLVETFPTNHETEKEFMRTLKFAYMYAKTVTLGMTHWPSVNRVMMRNRRIGCSMSGIAQFIAKNGLETLRQWCENGYNTIQNWDKIYSEWFAIPQSIKTTSIKPSGTVSLLAGATPGMHFPQAKYYIRRVRLAKSSDLIGPLVAAGYDVEESVTDKSAMVVSFPIYLGEGMKTVSEVTIWEQMCLAAFLQRYWSDNQVSCTVTFNPKTEASQIAPVLNYFQYQLKGISFLPNMETDGPSPYPQMPYETITKEKFEEMQSKIDAKKINFGANARNFENDHVVERWCDGDTCEIVKK